MTRKENKERIQALDQYPITSNGYHRSETMKYIDTLKYFVVSRQVSISTDTEVRAAACRL